MVILVHTVYLYNFGYSYRGDGNWSVPEEVMIATIILGVIVFPIGIILLVVWGIGQCIRD